MRFRIFSAVTGVAAIYHLLLAAAGFLCPAEVLVRVIQIGFGITVEADSQLSLVAKFASVYMLAFGLMLLLLSMNPQRYRAFALPALALFGLRLVNRVVFFGTLESFGMTVGRNAAGTVIILAIFAAILATLPRKDTSAHPDASAGTA